MSKSRGTLAVDPIANRDDGVKVVVLDGAKGSAGTFLADYRQILGSCRLLKLAFGVDLVQMKSYIL